MCGVVFCVGQDLCKALMKLCQVGGERDDPEGKPKELKIFDGHPYLIYREFGQGNTFSIEIIPIDGALTLEEQAVIYIASPDASTYKHSIQDDGTEFYEGISDTYPEGPHWIRLIQNDEYLLILKAYGGNKFMNSNRPKLFFSRVWFDH